MAQTATTSLTASLPPANMPWFDPNTGIPVTAVAQYFAALDQIMRAGNLGTLISAANDADAAKAGVVVGGFYRVTNAVQIRLA